MSQVTSNDCDFPRCGVSATWAITRLSRKVVGRASQVGSYGGPPMADWCEHHAIALVMDSDLFGALFMTELKKAAGING
jgi:hypothetical protein